MNRKSMLQPYLAPTSRVAIRQADLEAAIEERQLVLHYQPKVLFGKQKLIGFEALVRWNHPEGGLLGPPEFMRRADRSGLAAPLSRWVLNHACRQMASWHCALPSAPPLTISVNISIEYLMAPCLIPDVKRLLAETGLPPWCLQFELTESSVMLYSDTIRPILRKLRAMQIGLEIHGFGLGQASRRYLRELPFDSLKIDGSFVRELGSTIDSSGIIHSILLFASSLGMSADAQGVERADQFERLAALGCRRGQGYYFSRAVDTLSATAMITEEIRGMPGPCRGHIHRHRPGAIHLLERTSGEEPGRHAAPGRDGKDWSQYGRRDDQC